MTQITWPGAEGLPQLPFKRLFTPVKRTPLDGAQIVTAYTDGQVTLRSNRAKIGYHEAADTSTYLGVRKGDFVVHGLDIMRGSVGVSDSDGVISPVCTVCVPTPLIEPRYAAYAMRQQAASDFPKALARGVREGGADFRRWDTLAELPLPVPPVEEQRAIADYLDRETAQIDAFIAKNEELITLLAERRAAAISRAVTLGLDENCELLNIDSGWLGRVPVGWRFASIKTIGKVTLGKMLQERPSTESDVSMPYLRAASVQPNGVLDLSTIKEMWFSPREQQMLTLRRGDVVIVEGGVGGYGRAAFIATDLDRVGFQNSIVRVRPRLDTDGRYLTYVLLHLRAIGYIEMVASVASMPHFTAEKVAATKVPVPSFEEQAAIVGHLDKITRSIDRAIETARHGVEIARERRAALISAAVTGKIDVGVAV